MSGEDFEKDDIILVEWCKTVRLVERLEDADDA